VRVPTPIELRRGVLAVSVLHDVDLEPARLGVRLPGEPKVWVSWTECRRALAGHAPESEAGRTRLASWLTARRWAADLGHEHLRLALRPVGLPVDHLLHPGLGWVCRRVLGDALDLGLGAVGLDPADPERVVLLPTDVLDAAGIDVTSAWAGAEAELERLGGLAAAAAAPGHQGRAAPVRRRRRADPAGQPRAPGRAGRAVGRHGRRGRADAPARLDPDEPGRPGVRAGRGRRHQRADRGFARPLLLTKDEVTVVPEGGRPQDISLRDPVTEQAWQRDVLYR
jgi:hypothetical protein